MNDTQKKWMDDNCHLSKLASSNILPLAPDIGFYVTVNELDISENFFEEEFDQISEAYFSVLAKLEEHYKKTK